MSDDRPGLVRRSVGELAFWIDPAAEAQGVTVAFSERTGGHSLSPYDSLNLAAHVGDDPTHVDANRDALCSALGLGYLRHRLVVPEQVHGVGVVNVERDDAESGALASVAGARPPVPACDALITKEREIPLLLCFADCVPVVLVAPGPWIGVVHAGWRGALAGIVTRAVEELLCGAACGRESVIAYVGPHIGPCHYQVDEGILSQFVNVFGTVSRAESGGLDLGAVAAMSLRSAGVDPCNIASLAACTAETTDRFYSHRAEAGLTGRHGALACIR